MSARATVVLGEVFERYDESSERKFLVIFARLWFDRQKLSAFRVKDEKQPVEKDQTGIVNAWQISVGDFIFRTLGEAVREDLDNRKNSLAQVFFQLGLRGERVFAHVIKPALTLRVTNECRRVEKRYEKFESIQRLDRQLKIDRKKMARLPIAAIKTPFI